VGSSNIDDSILDFSGEANYPQTPLGYKSRVFISIVVNPNAGKSALMNQRSQGRKVRDHV